MMVLCLLSMTLGIVTLFCCNTHSIAVKVGDSKSYTSEMGLGTPCSRLWMFHALFYGDF
jgi:hypothetical protein